MVDSEKKEVKAKIGEKVLMNHSYFDDLKHFKKLGIELINKSIEFLVHAKRMLKKH